MQENLIKIEGFEISKNNKSNRIIDLYLKDEFIEASFKGVINIYGVGGAGKLGGGSELFLTPPRGGP